MISGIIKLFYSEVVKTKMGSMKSDPYKLRAECQDIKNITLRIDSMFFKIIKLIFGVVFLLLAFNINTIFGIGTFLIEISYIVYKKNLECKIKENLDNIKNNIEISATNIINEKAKLDFNLLVTLLLVGILTKFNYIIVISFMIVFLFTIKDIYSNIK